MVKVVKRLQSAELTIVFFIPVKREGVDILDLEQEHILEKH